MIIDVEPAVSDWVTWAKKNDIRADVIDFIRKTPDVFAATESNPRAWGYVSTVMNQLEKHQAKPDQMMNCITGLVGETMAVSYLSHRASKGSIKLTVQCLLTSYASCRAELKKLKQQNDTSRLHALVQEVLLYCQDPCNRGDQKHEQAKVAMLSQFAKDLPAEFRLRVNDFIPER
jgi:hypothetical protein